MRASFRERRDLLTLSGRDILGFHGVPVRTTKGDQGTIQCPEPAHDDNTPSCSVNLESGLFYCFGCRSKGDKVDLHRLLGGLRGNLEALEDLERLNGTQMPDPPQASTRPGRGQGTSRPKNPGNPFTVAWWHYYEADGTPAFDVIRREFRLGDGGIVIDPKSGKPKKDYLPTNPGGSRLGMPEPYSSGHKRPLYRLPDLVAGSPDQIIWIAEGEPAADAIASTGRIAATSSGGSSAAAKTDWSFLAGRRVVIWPDNDLPGTRYAKDVTTSLTRLNPPSRVRILKTIVRKLQKGGDAVDHLAQRELIR
ncbi:MAG: CHC2 zinc finger domain-containing protein [Planctomycetota bacterium]